MSDTRRASAGRPLRVAHCVHGLGLGGAQQIIRAIVALRSERIESHRVYSCEDGVLRGPVEAAGAEVRIVPRRVPKLDPLWAVALARRMVRDRIDVVHTHLFGDALHGYLAARAAGRPAITTLHCDYAFQSRLQRIGYRWRVSRTVACSEFVRRSFLDVDPRWEDAIVTIPNGIEPLPASAEAGAREALARELGVDPRAVWIASVGRLAEQKALDVLIRAVARLARKLDPAPCLILIGEGPQRGALERLASAEGVRDRVRFAGVRRDVDRLLPSLDVVAFSSIWEGLSVAMLEAMAAARCLVGTAVPGILEAVEDGREALVVPVGDDGALAAALERAVTSPGLREELGRAAQKRFLERFTAERMVRDYERLYGEVAAAA